MKTNTNATQDSVAAGKPNTAKIGAVRTAKFVVSAVAIFAMTASIIPQTSFAKEMSESVQNVYDPNGTLEIYADDADDDPEYAKYYRQCLSTSAADVSNSLAYAKYADNPKIFGIDVSKYQGDVNWSKVKSAGKEYAIIRAGYRGSSSGKVVADSKFSTYLSGAKAAGLKVGVYFYSQALNNKEAIEEANFCLESIGTTELDFPIYIDMEYASATGRVQKANPSKETLTQIAENFCNTVENAGYDGGIYANKSWLTSKFYANRLEKYSVWIANWVNQTTYGGEYDMWQYSNKGSVNGISGNVDCNVYFEKGNSNTSSNPFDFGIAGNEDAKSSYKKSETFGDVNGDGKVDPKDATCILRYAACNIYGTKDENSDIVEENFEFSDVNHDSAIDAKDATMILVYSAKYIAGDTRSFLEYASEDSQVEEQTLQETNAAAQPTDTNANIESGTQAETASQASGSGVMATDKIEVSAQTTEIAAGAQ